ncbi:hypothetical protein [Haloarcula marina]|uniref:hypothetical protein n=1 Tax=Haloarcula marina TaxID=2961574 RepID=UPI0020B8D1B8|nr:hypothetical protein [Halomicroarcula marina]
MTANVVPVAVELPTMLPTGPGAIGETPALLVIDPQRDFLDPEGAVYCPSSSVGDTERVKETGRVVR